VGCGEEDEALVQTERRRYVARTGLASAQTHVRPSEKPGCADAAAPGPRLRRDYDAPGHKYTQPDKRDPDERPDKIGAGC
jgi:hypothetical protein